jgi:hypothetical protein
MTISREALQDMLERAAAGEDVETMLREYDGLQIARDRVNRAQDRLERLIHDDEDPTGQDNERAIDAAAADLISARDNEFRTRDPEWYAEQRAMGMLD